MGLSEQIIDGRVLQVCAVGKAAAQALVARPDGMVSNKYARPVSCHGLLVRPWLFDLLDDSAPVLVVSSVPAFCPACPLPAASGAVSPGQACWTQTPQALVAGIDWVRRQQFPGQFQLGGPTIGCCSSTRRFCSMNLHLYWRLQHACMHTDGLRQIVVQYLHTFEYSQLVYCASAVSRSDEGASITRVAPRCSSVGFFYLHVVVSHHLNTQI